MIAEAVFGKPPAALAAVAPHAIQVSPLIVGATQIEDLGDGGLKRFTILAPPGTLERRYVLAHAMRALAADGEVVVLAPKSRGGGRIAAELAAFGCDVRQIAKSHHRICRAGRPIAPIGVAAAIEAGGPQIVPALGLWSQPGVFSWDRIDPGTTLLLAQPWMPFGHGADLGCGIGLLARKALKTDAVASLRLFDIDLRAIRAARRNVDDNRVSFHQHDLRQAPVTGLDFVIMNPPFHEGGAADHRLGQQFVETAAAMLKPGAMLRMVANVALAYERTLTATFTDVRQIAGSGGYKVLEAVK